MTAFATAEALLAELARRHVQVRVRNLHLHVDAPRGAASGVSNELRGEIQRLEAALIELLEFAELYGDSGNPAAVLAWWRARGVHLALEDIEGTSDQSVVFVVPRCLWSAEVAGLLKRDAPALRAALEAENRTGEREPWGTPSPPTESTGGDCFKGRL